MAAVAVVGGDEVFEHEDLFFVLAGYGNGEVVDCE